MAGKTDDFFIFPQPLIMVRGMGKVAAKAAVLADCGMLGLRFVKLLDKFPVAVRAQCRPVVLQVVSIGGAVGQMTIFTGLFYRLVNILLFKAGLFILVAAKAQVNPFDHQEKFILRGMRIVADHTVTPGNGTMDKLLRCNVVFVAGKTEVRERLFCEQEFTLRLVGVMADDALPFFNRSVVGLAL